MKQVINRFFRDLPRDNLLRIIFEHIVACDKTLRHLAYQKKLSSKVTLTWNSPNRLRESPQVSLENRNKFSKKNFFQILSKCHNSTLRKFSKKNFFKFYQSVTTRHLEKFSKKNFFQILSKCHNLTLWIFSKKTFSNFIKVSQLDTLIFFCKLYKCHENVR